MDKYRPRQPEDGSAGLDGPDYVAFVVEWEDPLDEDVAAALGDSLDDPAELDMAAVPPSESTSDSDSSWNLVDEASMESFPASDPPAWGSAHAVTEVLIAEAGVPEDLTGEVTTPLRSRTRMSGVRRIVLGVAAVAALLSMIEGLRRIRRHA